MSKHSTVDLKILEYARTELKKGFPKKSIRDALLKAGHDERIVEEHLLTAISEMKSIDKRLLSDIEKLKSIGKTKSEIKKLIGAEHSAEKVEKHLWHVFGETNDSILETIRLQLKNGLPKKSVREALVQAGNQERIVEENLLVAISEIENIDKDLLTYIEKLKAKGMGRSEIKKLIGTKHSEQKVEKHLWHVFGEMETLEKEMANVPKRNWVHIAVAAVVILVLLGSIGVYIVQMPQREYQRHYDSGMALYNSEDYSGALAELEKAHEIEKTAETYRWIGASYVRLKEYDKAIEYLEISNDMEPGDVDTLVGQGYCYLFLNNYDKSLQSWLEVKEKYPHDFRYATELGKIYFRIGDYQKAEEHYKYAITQDSQDSYTYSGLGWTYYIKRDLIDAINYFNLSNNIAENSDAFTGIGYSYYRMNEFNKAHDNFLVAIELDNNNALAYTGMGWNYLAQNNSMEAVRIFSLAVERNPDTKNTECSIYSGLAYANYLNKHNEKAREYVNILEDNRDLVCGERKVL
jgi:tetratricopeptide (TPR) repeat protein